LQIVRRRSVPFGAVRFRPEGTEKETGSLALMSISSELSDLRLSA
jgi:hypothetical protein